MKNFLKTHYKKFIVGAGIALLIAVGALMYVNQNNQTKNSDFAVGGWGGDWGGDIWKVSSGVVSLVKSSWSVLISSLSLSGNLDMNQNDIFDVGDIGEPANRVDNAYVDYMRTNWLEVSQSEFDGSFKIGVPTLGTSANLIYENNGGSGSLIYNTDNEFRLSTAGTSNALIFENDGDGICAANFNIRGSYLNFGSTLGTDGYGFKDNSGTLQYKNSGGAWIDIGTAINPANTVYVKSGATPKIGEVYTTIADAITYINTQSPALMDFWTIKVFDKTNSENFTVPDYVFITGDNGYTGLLATALTGNITLGNYSMLNSVWTTGQITATGAALTPSLVFGINHSGTTVVGSGDYFQSVSSIIQSASDIELDGQILFIDTQWTANDINVNSGGILVGTLEMIGGSIFNNGGSINMNSYNLFYDNTTSGLTAAHLGDAIDELASEKADKTNVLELDNITSFTPDNDYEPATKKYVDDNIGFSTAGRSLTADGSTINADVELYTTEKGVYIEDPQVEDLDRIFYWMNASTLTRVWCRTDTGTVDINIENNSGTNILSAELVCDSGGQTSCASGCDVNTIQGAYDNFAAFDNANISISATSSSPTALTIYLGYTLDD